MYKAIIVDDEESVSKGLYNHFDWLAYDIEIVGLFDDGVPALSYLQQNPGDIVLTDVRMTHMDGITLAKQALAQFPNIKIIFISGYADVNYLRDALKMDAVDYILKSIDLDELAAVITKVVHALDQRNVQQEIMLDMTRKLEQSMPLLRQRQLSDLLKPGDESEDELLQRVRFLGIPLDNQTRYVVLLLRPRPKAKWLAMSDMSEKDQITFSLALEELFEQVLRKYGVSVAFKERFSEYVAVMNAEDNEYEESLVSAAEELFSRIRSEMGIEIAVGISEPFSGLRQICAAYQSAGEAISRSYLIGNNTPISVKKYEDDSSKPLRERAEKEIIDAILNGDTEEVQAALKRAVEGGRSMEDEDEQQNFMLFLLLLPTRLMNNMQTANMGPYRSHRKLTMNFFQCRGINEQETMLSSVYADITQHLLQMSTPHTNTVIKRVREIIDAQYMEQLSVTSLADSVYLTPTYLCVLFKQATGRTINEYITQVRLDKAKEYLTQTNIHLYDVCYKVGYLSPSYFSRLFKKYNGMTPGEYRESVALKG
jgi:two-component system response regulator YesN